MEEIDEMVLEQEKSAKEIWLANPLAGYNPMLTPISSLAKLKKSTEELWLANPLHQQWASIWSPRSDEGWAEELQSKWGDTYGCFYGDEGSDNWIGPAPRRNCGNNVSTWDVEKYGMPPEPIDIKSRYETFVAKIEKERHDTRDTEKLTRLRKELEGLPAREEQTRIALATAKAMLSKYEKSGDPSFLMRLLNPKQAASSKENREAIVQTAKQNIEKAKAKLKRYPELKADIEARIAELTGEDTLKESKMKITKTKLKQIIAEEVAKLQEKNTEAAMMANMARAEAARRAALAAKKAEKKNNEAYGSLYEQEGLELDDLIEPVKTEIERSINDLSDQLMAIGMDEDGTIDVLNLLLTKLIADLEAGFVGPPA